MSEKLVDFESLMLDELRHVPSEYLPNLLQLVRLFRETVTLQPAEVSFRRGWEEAVRGETEDIAELWSGIDAE